MKNLMSLVAVLLLAISAGTISARADGGETGANASHTQPFWGYASNGDVVQNWNYNYNYNRFWRQ